MESNSITRLCIPYDIIEDHVNCSICLLVMRGAILTPCGHRYCTKCITEWVGRNHTCPCCNSALQATQFYSDVQFDSFVETILVERDKAEQLAFDSMFNAEATKPEGDSKATSPFEKILKNHMKSSLLSHQRYFNKLREDCQRKINLLDSGVSTELLSHEVSDKESIKATLKQNLEESEKLAADAYDKYLTDHLPTLDLLPVNVSVYIADKDVRIPDVLIHPLDKLSVIKPFVETAMRERCDELTSWVEDGGVRLLFSPLSKSGRYDLTIVMSSLDTNEDVHQLSWESQPFFQCHMRPGSEIVLQEAFKSQSDMPKRCFANVFREKGTHPVDYFSCETCRLRWICKSCVQCCHLGHKVAVFVMNHTPDWACCYCPKKKKCKIVDK